ncbi:MAG: hypothetical protein J6D14_01385 [Lachnospiraceae bacterium]|nr:hypothetical protein [Lachnospiraceae bacterium]
MKRKWKDAFPPVDESFERSMDRAFEVIRKENCQVKKKVGIGFILVAALVLVSATALAISVIRYSPRQDARTRAHAALMEKYGLTEEILTLFNETMTGNGSDWEINYDLPVYADYVGTYRVVSSRGKVTATWSHDGETYDKGGDLHDAVWGASQLEHMRQLYKAREETLAHYDELGTYYALSIEEKAAIDAPLLELPRVIDILHIAPEDGDIQPDEANALAQDEILRRYAEDGDALAECECRVTFMLIEEAREYELLFRMDDKIEYGVRLRSPSGEILSCQRFDGSDQGTGDLSEETVDDAELSIEARAALHDKMRKQGGDPEQWNSVLPETGDVSEADAISIAQSALLEQFGVTPDKLAMMETEVYCQIDYCFFDEPTRSWFVRFADSTDDYQVYLRASDGTVTDISNQGSVLGAG